MTRIFCGKTKPSKSWVGTENIRKSYKDKFGEMNRGEIRSCYIETKWGQLKVPFKYMEKDIEIIVKIRKAKRK